MTKPTIDERWMEWIQNGFISKTMTRGQLFRTIFNIFVVYVINLFEETQNEEEGSFGETRNIYAALKSI